MLGLRWRCRFGVAALLGVLLAGWCSGQNDKAKPPKADAPAPKLTISKETTWATEPLREDGFIDYLEAVNRRFSKDVTVENNACVLLYQAMGPRPSETWQPDRFFQRLGIPPLPDEGKYFQPLGDWLRAQPNAPPDAETVDEMHSTTSHRPWKRDEYPMIAQWLRANESSLRAASAASERLRYFSPLVVPDDKPDGGLADVLLPGVQVTRELSATLIARAMLELGEGSKLDAWRDLLAAHRLARLVAQGPMFIEYLVGVQMESRAIQGELRFLSETQPSAKLLVLYRKNLERLPPRSLVVTTLDAGERAMLLDSVHRIARGKMAAQEFALLQRQLASFAGVPNNILAGVQNDPLAQKLAEGVIVQSLDWNEVLKSGNKSYDRMCEVARKSNYRERIDGLRQLERDANEQAEKRRSPTKLLALLGDRPALAQAMTDITMSLLLPVAKQAISVEGRALQRMRHLELALSLAAWHSKYDAYPDSLDALVPKYLAEVPHDLFADRPLRYERTAKGYRFYSIGPNEQDDGGRNEDEMPPGDDLVVTMPVKAD